MLRELSAVLLDVHSGLDQFAAEATQRGVPIALTHVDITLPVDMQPVFRDGRCMLLGDVPRSRTEDAWYGMRSDFHVSWTLLPTTLFAEVQP